MNKKYTPQQIKKHTAAMRRFCMSPQPLLTLDGVQKKPTDNELEMCAIAHKTEVHEND